MTTLLGPIGSALNKRGLTLAIALALVVLVAAPLATILGQTLYPSSAAWGDVLASRLSQNLFWRPTINTMIIGLGVAVGCVLLGGFLAWLVVMTDVPGRPAIAFMATLPSPPHHLAGRRPNTTYASHPASPTTDDNIFPLYLNNIRYSNKSMLVDGGMIAAG